MEEALRMPVKIGGLLILFLGLSLGAGNALACETGQVLQPGDSCDLTVKWGTDHWIVAEFPDGDAHRVEITHLEGGCQVHLYGPIETDEVLLGPDQEPISRALEGEYHLFTRAIVVAREACRFRISVN
jgi:hypothetical protein